MKTGGFWRWFPVAAMALIVVVLGAALLLRMDLVGYDLLRAVGEPIALASFLLLHVIPQNLLPAAALALLIWDGWRLSKLTQQALVLEQIKMVVISAVLAIQYTKLSMIGSQLPSATARSALGAFGAAAIGFSVVFVVTLLRYLAERKRLLAEITPATNPAVANSSADRQPLIRRVALPLAAVACALFGLWMIAPLGERSPSTKEEIGQSPRNKPSEQGYRQEIVEPITVGPRPAPAGAAAGESGNASLPEGLRFSWQRGANNWEPAFIRQDPEGNFWWRGQRVSVSDPLLHAFAVDGPAVKPDAAEGLLFFHKDVLSHLFRTLASTPSPDLPAEIFVDQVGEQIALHVPGPAGSPERTLLVSAQL